MCYTIAVITKKCSKCEKELLYSAFPKNSTKKDGLSYSCRECHKIYTRDHYQKNKKSYLDKSHNHVKRLRALVNELKRGPCMDCGVSYPAYVMDFDHRDPSTKRFGISVGVRKARSFKDMKDEMDKCDLVCANCHRERTHGEN